MINRLVMKIFPKIHSLIYEHSNGRIGSLTGGYPNMLLKTNGALTGKERTTIICYVKDGDDYIIAGSNGGLDHEPGWVKNLRKNPESEIVIGNKKKRIFAEEINEADKDLYWKTMMKNGRTFQKFQNKTEREFPLFLLKKRIN